MIHSTETKSNSIYPFSFETRDLLLDQAVLLPRLRGGSGTYEERIAIIGSGPVGLNAANILSQLGYSHVTIFEARSEVGGILAVASPSFSFPSQASKHLIELLLRPGIDVRLRAKVEHEKAFAAIVRDFDATLLAMGAQHGLSGGIRGENTLKGVFSAHDMLCEEVTVSKKALQGKVAIIGGSRTTFDAAFVALEAGARVVHIFFPGSLSELPLRVWKRVSSGRKSALHFHPFMMPISFLGTEDMDVCGLHCRQTRWVSTRRGRHLTFVPGRGCLYPIDTVLIAIDEIPDLSFLPPPLVVSGPYGPELRLVDVCTTFLPGVFAAGDVVSNMTSLHEALAQGQEAAYRIHTYLRQKATEACLAVLNEAVSLV